MKRPKEFYVVTLDDKDVPSIITGPFATSEQAKAAAAACEPLDPARRFSVAGSESWSIRDVPH